MGFLSRLFGGSSSSAEDRQASEAVEHNGYRIRAAPFRADGQFQTAGIIEKDFPDGVREHRFIRAEKHASKEEAEAFAVTKGKQIVDGLGDRIFDAS
jgi:hypothetical protein